MKTTFSQSDLAGDMSAAGTMRASRQPMGRSIWVVLTMAVLAAAAPTVSDAQPQPTCQATCQRLTDCKMSSYTKMCLDDCKRNRLEASEEGRAQMLIIMRLSCQQIQSGVAAMQHQPRSSTPTASARNSSTRTPSTSTQADDAAAELDKLDQELNDFDQQAAADDAEIERRTRGVRGPGRGAGGPARGAGTPARGAGTPARGAGGSAKGRGSAQSSHRPSTRPYEDDDDEEDGASPSVNGYRGGRSGGGGYGGSSGSSGSGQWHCRAVGTYARGTPDGGPDYSDKQNIDVTKYGATRDAAGIAAINECSGMLNLETVSLPNSGALVLEYCRAISCSR